MQEQVEYRIQQSETSLADARLLSTANSWNSVVNRLYYSCFYILSAYFIQKKLAAFTHKGARILFHKELVLTKIVNDEESELFNTLFLMRHQGDYDFFRTYTKE